MQLGASSLLSDSMKLLLVLVVGSQFFHSSHATSFKALSCSEQRVVKAAELAVDHINADQPEGYKYVLNKVENAQEDREKQGIPFVYIEFEILETRCHSLNPKPVGECEVPSGPEAISGDCKMQLQMSRTSRCIEVQRYWCLISPDSDDMVLSRCPSCPHRIALNHTDASHAVAAALKKYNRHSNRTNYFAVKKITKASSQMLAGKKIFVEFVIQGTACAKTSPLPNCPVNEGTFASRTKAFCTATVEKPIPGREKVEVNCDFYRPKVAVSSVRNKVASCIRQRGQGRRNKRQSILKKKPGHKQASPKSGTRRRTESSEEVQGALGFTIGTGSRNDYPQLPGPRRICPGRARYLGGAAGPM
ncbi:fetuin-B-like [Amblyraja radiata]|uniref:fetuin-B-like n=1 Tax=Amblyraja radiata TaxID=386614 RepID=UPI001402F578|nr:fetuin-B-like [Amblyraja radiata]